MAAAPTVDPTLIAALESCEWVERGEPVVLLGDSGTGKSHLLIGLGMAACQRGVAVVVKAVPCSIWPSIPRIARFMRAILQVV